MYNKLIFKNFENDAHLAEHLVLNRFISRVKEENLPIECIGFFNGEAFSNEAAFYGDFYIEKAANIFEQIVNSGLEFTKEEVLEAKKMIRAEESDKESVLRFRLKNLNLIEKKVALRLFPLVYDYVLDFCRNNFAYLQEDTSLVDDGDDLIFVIRISFCDDIDLANFQAELVQNLRNYPVKEKFAYIENMFRKAVECGQFYLLPLDFYRFTGIKTSNGEILELLSPERVSKIFENIKIEILS